MSSIEGVTPLLGPLPSSYEAMVMAQRASAAKLLLFCVMATVVVFVRGNGETAVFAVRAVTVVGTMGVSGFLDHDNPTLGTLNCPWGVAFHPVTGDLLLSVEWSHRIRRVSKQSGRLETLAGQAASGTNDGVGTTAQFHNPMGIAFVPGQGDLYVADHYNNAIRKVATGTGDVSTAAGMILSPYGNSDNVIAVQAKFHGPSSVACAVDSTVFVADQFNHAIRKMWGGGVVTVAGNIATVAYGKEDGVGANAKFHNPMGLALDANGQYLYVADYYNHVIRRVTTTNGEVVTLAGQMETYGTSDGLGATAQFHAPLGIAIHPASTDLFVADYFNHAIRRVTVDGRVTTVTGTMELYGTSSQSPVQLHNPTSIAVGPTDGDLYVTDYYNYVIRRVPLVSTYSSVLASAVVRPVDADITGWQTPLTTGIGQMVYIAQRDTLFLPDIYRHTVNVIDSVSASVRSSVPFNTPVLWAGKSGTTAPTYAPDVPVARTDARFNFPLGMVPVCPSSASGRQRLRFSCEPFALLVATNGQGTLQLVGVGIDATVRIVAGSATETGHLAPGAGPFNGAAARFTGLAYLNDMLDGGSFGVVVQDSHCVAIVRSVNVNYEDSEGFGQVNVSLFAGRCGVAATSAPPDGTVARGNDILKSPLAMVVHPRRTAAYVTQVFGLTKIAGTVGSPTAVTSVLFSEIGTGAINYHPLFPDTLLATAEPGSSDLFAMDTNAAFSSPVRWGINSPTRLVRHVLALPSGVILLSFGGFPGQSPPWIRMVCCYRPWDATRTASVTATSSQTITSTHSLSATSSLTVTLTLRTLSSSSSDRSLTMSTSTRATLSVRETTTTTTTDATPTAAARTRSRTNPMSVSIGKTLSRNSGSVSRSGHSASQTDSASRTLRRLTSLPPIPSAAENVSPHVFNEVVAEPNAAAATVSEAEKASSGLTLVSALAVAAANPVAAQQASRARATLVLASRCVNITARTKAVSMPPPPTSAAVTANATANIPVAAASSPPSISTMVVAISANTSSTKTSAVDGLMLPTFPNALMPFIGVVGGNPTRAAHRACILGNMAFIAVFAAAIVFCAWLRGPVLKRSTLSHGLQLVRWPGSLILPATLAADGSLSSAFFLIGSRGGGGAVASIPEGGGGSTSSPPPAVDALLFDDGFMALDVCLFAAIVGIASLQVVAMTLWGRWGLRHATGVDDAVDHAPTGGGSDGGKTKRGGGGASTTFTQRLLGLNFRWVLNTMANDSLQTDPRQEASNGAFSSCGVVFQKCHGPQVAGVGGDSSGGVSVGASGLLRAARRQWSPLYCAVDFAMLLASSMIQGAATAAPLQACVGGAAGLCLINVLSLVVSATLRPFLSPAKNVLMIASAVIVCASSVTLIVATVAADESIVQRLVKGTAALSSLGSALSCAAGCLSLCQRIYTIAFRSNEEDAATPNDKGLSMEGSTSATSTFPLFGQALLRDADLLAVAATLTDPDERTLPDPTEESHQVFTTHEAPRGERHHENEVSTISRREETAAVPANKDDRGVRLQHILDDDDDDFLNRGDSSVAPVARGGNDELLRAMTCNGDRGRVLRRSEEGQRRFDELQLLLSGGSYGGGVDAVTHAAVPGASRPPVSGGGGRVDSHHPRRNDNRFFDVDDL